MNLFAKTQKAETGKLYEIGNAAEFNRAAFMSFKMQDGDVVLCQSDKGKSWGYPIFTVQSLIGGRSMDTAPAEIKMTYKAKGAPESYGLKTPAGPGQHGGFGA